METVDRNHLCHEVMCVRKKHLLILFLLDGKEQELFEGDIVRTEKIAFDASDGEKWPNGEVPYTLADGFSKKSSILYFVLFQDVQCYSQ